MNTDPLIWREVEVPTSITLKVLHDIAQVAMGWLDEHLWEFRIGLQTYGLPMDEDWGSAPRLQAAKVRLRDVLQPVETTIEYLCDFGDSWEHRLTATAIRPGEPGVSYPRYIGGEWSCPPEDCGGIPGFYTMLEAWADPKNRTMPTSANTSMDGILGKSTNSRSPSHSDASQIAATPPKPGSPRKRPDQPHHQI